MVFFKYFFNFAQQPDFNVFLIRLNGVSPLS